MKDFYTINDIATMTGLTTRTIRNYIKLGILEGVKENGIWQFTPEEFASFIDDRNVKPSIQTKKNSIIYDFMADTCKKKASACLILDNEMDNESAQEVSNYFCNLMNGNSEYGDVHFSFQRENSHIRIIFSGDMDKVYTMMQQYYEQFG